MLHSQLAGGRSSSGKTWSMGLRRGAGDNVRSQFTSLVTEWIEQDGVEMIVWKVLGT